MFALSKLFATMHSNKHQTVSSFHGEDHGDFWGVSGRASVLLCRTEKCGKLNSQNRGNLRHSEN